MLHFEALMLLFRTIDASFRSIDAAVSHHAWCVSKRDGALSHHAWCVSKRRWCCFAPCMVRFEAAMVRFRIMHGGMGSVMRARETRAERRGCACGARPVRSPSRVQTSEACARDRDRES